MAVELTPPSACWRGECGSCRAENIGDRLRERQTERSNRCDARTRLRATDQYRHARGGKPADGHRRAEPFPCARGSGDLGRTSHRTPTERERTARPVCAARDVACDRVDNAVTGWSKATRTGTPAGTVSQRLCRCATGARTLSRSRRSVPISQPSQPGRRITTSTDTRSPGANLSRGVRRPWCSESGIARPSGPDACALSSVPPSGCTSTRASATASEASVAPDHNNAAATNPLKANTAAAPQLQSARLRPRLRAERTVIRTRIRTRGFVRSVAGQTLRRRRRDFTSACPSFTGWAHARARADVWRQWRQGVRLCSRSAWLLGKGIIGVMPSGLREVAVIRLQIGCFGRCGRVGWMLGTQVRKRGSV